MMKKRGLQLSLNMIIMAILALVFLGIAITLIYKWMPKIPDYPDQCDLYPPTADEPVCVPNVVELKRGDEVNLGVAFFNDEDADIPESEKPTITCETNTDGDDLDFSISTIGTELPVGEYKDYDIVIKIDEAAIRSTYPCRLRLSNTDKGFAITIE